jgi:UDP-4-amino-4,6-dideoxy-N-acetyl-beta-L-altrosamine N-acetyltransferase
MTDLRKNINLNGIDIINFINLKAKEKELTRKWRNHADVRKWMYSDHIISRNEHNEFINKLAKDMRNVYWLIKAEDNEYMGVIYLNRLDFKNKAAYLGIYSNPEDTFSGTGRLLIECLTKLAFRILHLHSLKLEVIETNKRAIRFYKKAGFSEEGRLKEFVIKEGHWCDVIIMGKINKGNS